MPTKEVLLAKAKQPAEGAMRWHPLYRGKVQMLPGCPVRNAGDFSIWYIPGVAVPCRAIHETTAGIWPWEAQETDARIVVTERGDFANQVNNSLGFRGIFCGALDIHAHTVSSRLRHDSRHDRTRRSNRADDGRQL